MQQLRKLIWRKNIFFTKQKIGDISFWRKTYKQSTWKDHEISLQTNPDFSWRSHSASSKKGFVKLVESRPNVVNYIRKLTYKARSYNDDDQMVSSILSNFLPTISRLNCLAINAFHSDWDALDSSLTSAFLHLMRFPTINHIDLSNSALHGPAWPESRGFGLARAGSGFVKPQAKPMPPLTAWLRPRLLNVNIYIYNLQVETNNTPTSTYASQHNP